MVVHFYSLDQENQRITYTSEAKIEDNSLVFLDKSVENTTIYIRRLEDKLVFERKGDVQMQMTLILNQKTKAYYKNNFGLEFSFQVECHRLEQKKNRIDLEYTMFLDSDAMSRHKIWIIIR